MCIAIVQKAGKRVKDEWLRSSFTSNPDGAGFAYIKEGKVLISKGFMDMFSFMAEYDRLHTLFGQDNAMLLHCRIATAGKVNKHNCHPFPIKGGALIHNGHLWSVPKGFNAKKSDTREFAEMFYNILNFDDVSKAIADNSFMEAIGYDRMAMLYDDGRYVVTDNWHEEEEALFSNGGYRYGRYSTMPDLVDNDDWNYYQTCMT